MVRDMTQGSVVRHLVSFSVPLVLGNLLQMAYNAVDSIIVGRFAGKNALAAVGTADPVMNLLILGVSGLCVGASALMSEAFGARDALRVRRCFASVLYLGLAFSVLVVSLGLPLSGPLLRALDVPAGILPQAQGYLRIILLGMPFAFLYNACAAGMRSMGDARTPVVLLGVSSVFNTLLDLLFVARLGLGPAGAGLATLLAEAVSAALGAALVFRQGSPLRLARAELQPDSALIRLTLRYGGITALQQACQPLGKLLIQRCVNGLGVEAMAVFNAVGRVDEFALTPARCISDAGMTFVAQNRGARRPERMRQGLLREMMVWLCCWVMLFSVLMPLRLPIMRLFVGQDAAAAALGGQYLFLMAFFYLPPGLTNGIQGFFRGIGQMKITLLGTITQISVRAFCVWWWTPWLGLTAVAWASLTGWLCMLLPLLPLLRRAWKSL